MKIKFTKRSEKDGTLVTVALSQFDEWQYYGRVCVVGAEITIVIDGVPTIFTCSRPDGGGYPSTANTRGYPRHLRLPRVGHPVYAEVTEVR